MKVFIFCCLFVPILSFGQNQWPKSCTLPNIVMYSLIEDSDGGLIGTGLLSNDGNSYLLKFDANANLIWKKCLPYQVTPFLWATHFIKDRFKNLYIVGGCWDTDPQKGDMFILKLDSCYQKVQCVVFTDSISKDQQYANSNYDFNDSLFLLSGWGFGRSGNQFIFINKSNLAPVKVYTTSGSSSSNNSLTYNGSFYISVLDFYHQKGGDTTSGSVRSTLLKFNETGEKVFYKFFGYEQNIKSIGYNTFKNTNNNLFVFSIFYGIPNDSSNHLFSPVLYECDTNGKLLNYKIYRDDSVNQSFNNVLKFNDSIYFMATTYLNKGVNSSAVEKIKLYKLNGLGKVIDSFYANNWGRKLFTKASISYINLLRTFDNKVMCAFPEWDSNFTNLRLTFIKFDENFKLDTVEYRNKIYDGGCVIFNDSIDLSDAKKYYFDLDSSYPILKLTEPLGSIPVPRQLAFSFYPNPINTFAVFKFENLEEGELKIILLDSKGAEVSEIYNSPNILAGECYIKLNFATISNGQYYLKVYMNRNLIHTIKVIKD